MYIGKSTIDLDDPG